MKDKITVHVACWSKTNREWLDMTLQSIRKQGIEPIVDFDERRTSVRWYEMIQKCDTPYLHLAHHDDVYLPGFYKETTEYLDAHPEAAAVFTMDYIVNENFKRIGGTRLPFPPQDTYDFKFIFESMLMYGNFLRCPSVVMRVEKCRGLQYASEECDTAEDTAMWYQILAKRGPIGIIDKPLFIYRQSPGSDTQKNVVNGIAWFDHSNAMNYAAKLKPDAVPWRWALIRDKAIKQREDAIEENRLREVLGSASRVRFIVVHEPPDNAGTGILCADRCRRSNAGNDDEISIYVFPIEDGYSIPERSGIKFYKGIPIIAIHAAKFGELVSRYSPSSIEYHHLLRWDVSILKHGGLLFLHDSYLWCSTWHQVTTRGVPCTGPEEMRCCECVGRTKWEETETRRKAVKEAVNSLTEVYANSQWLADEASTYFSCKVKVYDWPVPELPSHPTYRSVCGYFGYFSPVKGTDVLLQAARQFPEVQFLLYCDVPDDLKQSLETPRRLFGLPNVLFMGRYDRNDLPFLAARMDFAVVPSRSESWGLVARELRQQGLTVIATKTGGLDGDVKPGDVEALAEAIRRVV